MIKEWKKINQKIKRYKNTKYILKIKNNRIYIL